MLNSVQNALRQQCPEFADKKELSQYYISFEFPEKQRKMASWWHHQLDTAIRLSHQVFLSPADLAVIFAVHGFKPLVLPDILDHLCKNQILEWRDRPQIAPERTSAGFLGLGRLTGLLWKSEPPTAPLTAKQKELLLQDTSSKIISTEYLQALLHKVRKLLEKNLTANHIFEHTISYQFIYSILGEELAVSSKSLVFLLDELSNSGHIVMEEVGGQEVLVYSARPEEIRNPVWVEVEKNKYLLRSKIEYFGNKIEAKWREEQKGMEEARSMLGVNEHAAKRALQRVRMLRKMADEYHNRLKLLKNTLDQLELQEADKVTVETLQKSQDIISRTMVDASEVEQVFIKHLEIEAAQREIQENLKEVAQSEAEEDIAEMLRDLERELEKDNPKKIKEPVHVALSPQKMEQQIQLPQKAISLN